MSQPTPPIDEPRNWPWSRELHTVLRSRRTLLKASSLALLAGMGTVSPFLAFAWRILWVPAAALLGLVATARLASAAYNLGDDRDPDRRSRFIRRAITLVAAILAVVVMRWSAGRLFERVEEAMDPVISAVNRFHTAHGSWPRSDSDLVPAYLSEIPSCPYGQITDAMGSAAWWNPKPDGMAGPPIITCGITVFLRYSYRFEVPGWSSWD